MLRQTCRMVKKGQARGAATAAEVGVVGVRLEVAMVAVAVVVDGVLVTMAVIAMVTKWVRPLVALTWQPLPLSLLS